MEEFKKGEIVLFKNYIEEPDWQFGIFLDYEKDAKDGKPYIVNPYFTESSNNTFSIDKYKFAFRHMKKLPNINFGNSVIWGEEKEEHAN